MALPCVEVAEAPSSEAFRANPKDTSIVQPALGILKSSKGIVKYAAFRSEALAVTLRVYDQDLLRAADRGRETCVHL